MARIIAESAAASHGRTWHGPRLEAGHPWFEQELWLIRPSALICLGVTASSAVLRRRVTIRDERGQTLLSPQGIRTYVTVHPSAILRIPDRAREADLRRLASDLRQAARGLRRGVWDIAEEMTR
jgi:uracil-DNA glycosylase